MSPFPVRALLGAWLAFSLRRAAPSCSTKSSTTRGERRVQRRRLPGTGPHGGRPRIHRTAQHRTRSSGPRGWGARGRNSVFISTGTTLPEGGFLVLSPDIPTASRPYTPSHRIRPRPLDRTSEQPSGNPRTRDRNGSLVESVSYRSDSPWPISANALGADDDWTHLHSEDYQYRGRSLERVSPTHPASDPANWLASPSPPAHHQGDRTQRRFPSPSSRVGGGRPAGRGRFRRHPRGPGDPRGNAFSPRPPDFLTFDWVVSRGSRSSGQTGDDSADVAGGKRTRCTVSGGSPQQRADRSVIRYRIHANRGAGDEVVSPRPDDPMAWHSWFVTPRRAQTTDPIYDVFISRASLTILRTNIASDPKRVIGAAPPRGPARPGTPRNPPSSSTMDACTTSRCGITAANSRRDVSRKSQGPVPRLRPAGGTFPVCSSPTRIKDRFRPHRLRAAGLPTPRIWWSDLYMNNDGKLRPARPGGIR